MERKRPTPVASNRNDLSNHVTSLDQEKASPAVSYGKNATEVSGRRAADQSQNELSSQPLDQSATIPV